MKRHHIWFRRHPCVCDECINYRWGQCQQIAICGGHGQHRFNVNIPYPKRIDMQQLQRLSTPSNNQVSNHNDSCTRNVRDQYNIPRYSPYP